MEGARWHRPGTAVARGDVDEVRFEMHVGIVGQRVVLWVILERTRRLVVDGDRNSGRTRTTSIVGLNRVGRGRRLQDRWNAPNHPVAGTKVQARWQGRADCP